MRRLNPGRKNFEWTDYSIPLTKPLDVNGKKELKEKLRNRISLVLNRI